MRTSATYGILLRRVVLSLAVFLVIVLYVSLFENRYVDDAYIQLQYVRNVIDHHTWGFLPGRVSNTATAPLSVIVLAVFGAPFRELTEAVVWLTAAELVAILALLILLSRRLFGNRYFGLFAFLALATNPLVLSTIGLEGILFTLLLVTSIYFFVARRWIALAVTLGLLTLTRPDGALLFLIFLAALPVPRRQKGLVALVYAAVQLPWYVYSWLNLGFFLPDTLLIKAHQHGWPVKYWNGLGLYWEHFPVAIVVTFALLPLALFVLRTTNRDVKVLSTVLFTYGTLHYVAYAVLQVPPYHWYFLNQAVPAALLAALGFGCVMERQATKDHWARVGPAVLLAAPVIGLLLVAQEKGFRFDEPPIHSNWATARRYEEIAVALRDRVEPTASVVVSSEIGTLTYFSHRILVNEMSDMNVTTDLIEKHPYMRTPIVGEVLRFGMQHRRRLDPLPPPRYQLLQAVDDPALLADPRLVGSWPASTTWIPRSRIYLFRLT